MKDKIRKILLVFFVILFLFGTLHVVKYQYELKVENEKIEDVRKKVMGNSAETDVAKEQISEKKQILPQYEQLYKENSDLLGWIEIKNTPINYPVMQTHDDPTYYIHKDWEKNESKNGLPLMDARCNLKSENIIIYSHNMKNGTMFGSLKKYQDKTYYEEHQVINFNTIYEEAQYEIIGVFLSKIYYDEKPPEDEFVFYEHLELDSKEKFLYYIDNVKKLSLYDTGKTAQYGEQLITLCTCNHYIKDGRLLVVAKKCNNKITEK